MISFSVCNIEYLVFALEEGFPFFVAAWLYFVAFLVMLYYVRNLSAYKGSTLSQHSITRGRLYGYTAANRSEMNILTRQTSDTAGSAECLGDELNDDDENQLFYKI